MTSQPVYLNPVHPRPCPDPFVLKHLNEYWCYCTGFRPDGRCFGVLHSRDLVDWREVGSAMEPIDDHSTCYWAPEVRYENGVFLMYYSVGNEERMQIRVARADHPAGPFVDCGARLTSEDFAIDPHIFEDDDGARWMFYATDFLEHTHIGTGTVCDRMVDAFTLADDPRPVTRARHDWQVYDPHRVAKGGVRWHTVEGPFTLKRKGHYYQMFSGGNWQNESYGADYAISEKIVAPEEWRQVADGQVVMPVLRTIPGEVIGPGHNSVIRGPDNRQFFCVYHRWSVEAADRVMAIDRLDWAGERLLVIGPSVEPQPAPSRPTFADYFDEDREVGLGEGWRCDGGQWSIGGGAARQTRREGKAEALCAASAPHFVAEVSLRIEDDPAGDGAAGIKLVGEQEPILFFNLVPKAGQAVLTARAEGRWVHHDLTLPPDFDFKAFHLLRVEINGLRAAIEVDGAALKWKGRIGALPVSIALTTENAAADFAGFALTEGWEDLFTGEEADPEAWGWRTTANDDRWRVREDQLWFPGPHGEASILTKGPTPREYELVVNAKLIGESRVGECYGFFPSLGAAADSPLLTVDRHDAGWAVFYDAPDGRQMFPLPQSFDPAVYQQFRFRREQDCLTIQHEAQVLGKIGLEGEAAMIGLFGNRVVAAFDMVRVTTL